MGKSPHHQARKRFGQHFLHDPAIINRIVAELRPAPTDRLLEIGPGLGALTEPLLDTGLPLTVVEVDRDLASRLRETYAPSRLTVIEADALTVDLAGLAPAGHPLRVVGNLPYNISTPLIFHLLAAMDVIQDLHIMVQKEVVDRLAARAGEKPYGRLSVMVAARATATRLFNVGPGAFRPPPKVDSSVVRIVPHAEPAVPTPLQAGFAAVVRLAFSQRRKTLRRVLAGQLDSDAIAGCGVDPGARPETLDVAQYAALARALEPRA